MKLTTLEEKREFMLSYFKKERTFFAEDDLFDKLSDDKELHNYMVLKGDFPKEK